jgi:hypothetical protein
MTIQFLVGPVLRSVQLSCLVRSDPRGERQGVSAIRLTTAMRPTYIKEGKDRAISSSLQRL